MDRMRRDVHDSPGHGWDRGNINQIGREEIRPGDMVLPRIIDDLGNAHLWLLIGVHRIKGEQGGNRTLYVQLTWPGLVGRSLLI